MQNAESASIIGTTGQHDVCLADFSLNQGYVVDVTSAMAKRHAHVCFSASGSLARTWAQGQKETPLEA
jgi:hypothetical protein